jgi:hypothetical protein
MFRRAVLFALVVGCGSEGGLVVSDGGADVGKDALPTQDGSPGSDASSDGGTTCTPYAPPKCDAAPPDPGPKRSFRHTSSSITAATGFANHRGRDLFLRVGDPQWVLGKFAYGVLDDDIKDEDVDVWLLRDCGTQWEKLGTAVTTLDNQHAAVEGVADTGGRIYFTIPTNKALGLGRHRLRLVVGGDLSATEMFIEVVPAKMPLFVTDVDGTLTTSENAEFPALLTGNLPDAHPDAAAALRALASKGYRPFYVTARPEFLVQRTREFLDTNAFPPGLVHTTLTLTGATGAAAATYKTDELAMIAARGLVPSWGIGNTASDADAYDNAKIQPLDHRLFFQFTDTVHGGKRIESYTDLIGPFSGLPGVCP